jgi:hypothetical protein
MQLSLSLLLCYKTPDFRKDRKIIFLERLFRTTRFFEASSSACLSGLGDTDALRTQMDARIFQLAGNDPEKVKKYITFAYEAIDEMKRVKKAQENGEYGSSIDNS